MKRFIDDVLKFIGAATAILLCLLVISETTKRAQITDLDLMPFAYGDSRFTKWKVSTTSSGTFSTGSTSYVDVTNATVSFKTTGRPVFVGMTSDGTSNNSRIITTKASANVTASSFKMLRDATSLGVYGLYLDGGSAASRELDVPSSSISYLDTPAPGTYTYKLQAQTDVSSGTAAVYYSKVLVYELP